MIKKIIPIVICGIIFLTTLSATIHPSSQPAISQYDYYNNAPFSPIATLSSEKKEEINDFLEDKEIRERQKEASKKYKKLLEEKKIAEIEEAKRAEEEKRIAEEKRLAEEKRIAEENRIEKRQTEEAKNNVTAEIKKEEPVATPAGKAVSGNRIENPLVEVKDLSASDKQLAYQLIEAIKNGEKEMIFYDESYEGIINVVQAVQNEYFYVYLDSELVTYLYSDDTVHVEIPSVAKGNYEKSQFVTKKIKEFANSLKGQTEKNAVKKINDWIVNNVHYNAAVRDLYSLMHDHVGNCDSNSQFFELICDEIGIDAKAVEGSIVNTGDHMWNRVKVDGVWYYIDTTFNQTYGDAYFLSPSLWTDTHIEKKQYKRQWVLEE